MIAMNPAHSQAQIDQLVKNIELAARATFGQVPLEEVDVLDVAELDDAAIAHSP